MKKKEKEENICRIPDKICNRQGNSRKTKTKNNIHFPQILFSSAEKSRSEAEKSR